ncbi:hypothetical protein [Clostridium estertheticum]|nr:hypothetical protein [Clostridium estertheticum]MBU3198554.1 hypothetical protein [Clostridium estertheticum]
MEVLSIEDGIEKCRTKLMECFLAKGRKNPKSDAYTYCSAIRLLREYVKIRGLFNNTCYGPEPSFTDEIEQHLTIKFRRMKGRDENGKN